MTKPKRELKFNKTGLPRKNRAILEPKKTEEAIRKAEFEPIPEYPKIVRYADNHPSRVLKAMYPEIRAHYTEVYTKYQEMLPIYNAMADEYSKMFKKYNSLLAIAKNVRKSVSGKRPRLIRKVKGDVAYYKILKQKNTLKQAISEHMAAKLWTLRYEDMPASLNVKLLYEKFLKDEGIKDDLYKVLYVVNIYRYCLLSDMEWWGISNNVFNANIKHLIAMGYVEKINVGRSRIGYTANRKGKQYLSKLKTYSDRFYRDLMTTSDTNLKSDSFGIKIFAYSKYGRDKFRKFNGGAEAIHPEPTEEG